MQAEQEVEIVAPKPIAHQMVGSRLKARGENAAKQLTKGT